MLGLLYLLAVQPVPTLPAKPPQRLILTVHLPYRSGAYWQVSPARTPAAPRSPPARTGQGRRSRPASPPGRRFAGSPAGCPATPGIPVAARPAWPPRHPIGPPWRRQGVACPGISPARPPNGGRDMTISDMTEPPAGVEELLPAWLAARYRSRRHLAALVEIGRVLRGVGMTWKTLHRVTEEPAFGGAATEWAEYPAGEVLAMVEKLER